MFSFEFTSRDCCSKKGISKIQKNHLVFLDRGGSPRNFHRNVSDVIRDQEWAATLSRQHVVRIHRPSIRPHGATRTSNRLDFLRHVVFLVCADSSFPSRDPPVLKRIVSIWEASNDEAGRRRGRKKRPRVDLSVTDECFAIRRVESSGR